MLDINMLCGELEAEIERIRFAITSLRAIPGELGASTNGNHGTAAVVKQPEAQGGQRRHMSAAARKRISEAQKARWAAQRKAPPKARRTMSAAARNRASEAMKARWAARKAA